MVLDNERVCLADLKYQLCGYDRICCQPLFNPDQEVAANQRIVTKIYQQPQLTVASLDKQGNHLLENTAVQLLAAGIPDSGFEEQVVWQALVIGRKQTAYFVVLQ